MPPQPTNAVLRIALPLPLPQCFDYLPPDGVRTDAALIGCRVRVPFGNRELVGMIDAVGAPDADAPASGERDLKRAILLLDHEPVLQGELLATLRWAARYYHTPLGEAIATALPAALRRGDPLPETCTYGWMLTEAGRTGLAGLRKHTSTRRLAERIATSAIDEDILDAQCDGWRSATRALGKRGYAERLAVTRDGIAASAASGHPLNPAQRVAADAVLAARDRFQPVLLEGVTGSGKTEVYLEAIADCLARGKQALVLVPEIGLTPQTLRRFRAQLGVTVHALHSGLADGERARVWTAMARGEARVLVGTRSAIFTPLPDAGLIVVDEEHDASYKQQDGMRYHARDLALVRGKALGVPVLLGSATPSLESLQHAIGGRYMHLQLRQRAGDARPPSVRVIDVRKRVLDGGLSQDVLDAIGATLARGEQALVFKNRRGYAPVLLCHDCGWSARCKRCDAAMTVHARGGRLICHHCGARQSAPQACPDCASLALVSQGAGTERIEDTLAKHFPDTPLLRVDRGTTRHRDALEKHLATLGEDAGILVGTQMLAKGHDLPNLTLVCVVGVDEGLHSVDFRAPEKLAQLLIQVAGRGGRARKPGTVLLQTHHPEHPLLGTLLSGGYPAFAALELAQREAAGFPPYGYLALLRAEAPTDAAVQQFLIEAKEKMLGSFKAASNEPEPFSAVSIHGPLPAPMPRRAGKARAQLHLSARQRTALQAALSAWMPQLHALKSARKVRWSLDVDPVDLY